MKKGTYLNLLYTIEQQLPTLLKDPSLWKTKYVDYARPYVERVYTDYLGLRINLHRISSCEDHAELFHPHPWPSAMRIIEGSYEMNVGYGTTDDLPSIAATIILPTHTAYEMIDPHGWHSVRPLTLYSLSLMISGKPWGRNAPKSARPLRSLSEKKKLEILKQFSDFYK